MYFYKEMCIQQGYVPPTCTMDGQMCFLLVQSRAIRARDVMPTGKNVKDAIKRIKIFGRRAAWND